MAEHPILFSGGMIRAILDGRKTQTRRIVKPQPPAEYPFAACDPNGLCCWSTDGTDDGDCYPQENPLRCPYGVRGDRLWVRETFLIETWTREFGDIPPLPSDRPWKKTQDPEGGDRWQWAHYASTDEKPELCDMDDNPAPWKPSIHMPRWASRITLEIVKVRVQRVRYITDSDAIEEGVSRANTSIPGYARERFKALWDSLNAKRGYGWDLNPWVWVIEFTRTLN